MFIEELRFLFILFSSSVSGIHEDPESEKGSSSVEGGIGSIPEIGLDTLIELRSL